MTFNLTNNDNPFFEIFNDLLCADYLLEIKKQLKDIEAKNYFAWFLKPIISTVVYETNVFLKKFNQGKIKNLFKEGIYDKVREARMLAIKENITQSKKTQDIIKKMGLNFNSKIYDCNIVLSKDELIDLNFEMYYENTDDTDFWDALYKTPKVYLDVIFSLLDFEKFISELYTVSKGKIATIALNFDEEKELRRYSYSVYNLFLKSKNLTQLDKLFILYRYRKLKSFQVISKYLPDEQVIYNGINILNFDRFFKKFTALTICTIGEELMNLKSIFSAQIILELDKQIDKSFYPLNRQLRNNIHYSEIKLLSNAELKQLNDWQSKYIDIVLTSFDNVLNINLEDN